MLLMGNSEAGTLLSCAQKYGFQYVDLLRPKREVSYFAFGGAFHAGIEAGLELFYGPEDGEFDEAIERGRLVTQLKLEAYQSSLSEVDASPFLIDDARKEALNNQAIASHLIGVFFDRMQPDLGRLIPIGIEQPFQVSMTPWVGTVGAFDLVWFDPHLMDFLIDDWKTTSGKVDALDDKLEMDPQMTSYAWALRKLWHAGAIDNAMRKALGKQADKLIVHRDHAGFGRTRINVFRKKIPSEPRILKNGRVSSAANQDVTWEAYSAALFAQDGEADDKQMALLESIMEKGDRWFAQREMWRTEEQCKRWYNERLQLAKRAMEIRCDVGARVRNVGHCTGPMGHCSYSLICPDHQQSSDVPEEMLTSFRRADVGHEHIVAIGKPMWTDVPLQATAANDAPGEREQTEASDDVGF